MSTRARAFRISLQAKVLLVVLAFLVVVPAVIVWIVNDHVARQVEDEARRTLKTAEAVFLQSLEIRSRNFLVRYRDLVNQPRFKAVAQLGDAKTMTAYLRDLLEESNAETEILFFVKENGELLAGARRDATLVVEAFAKAARSATEIALEGGQGADGICFGGRIYTMIAVPGAVREGGPITGALVAGIRFGESAVQEMKVLTRAEILVLAEDKIAASTLSPADSAAVKTSALDDDQADPENVRRSLINGEHYLSLDNGVEASPGFRYVLLSSYEDRLLALEKTRTMLVVVSGAGILLSALVVGFFVSRVTRPLRELRDIAEAVGRGDFSRRVERFSNDECGDVAESFNRMTKGLESSRGELEKAVETLRNTQAQLVQSEKLSAVGQFVAGVAHELNNPLTAVIGFAELLRETVTDEESRPQLEMISRSAQRCQRIVQSLLSFSRQHAPERKLLSIGNVIDDVLEIMAYDLRTSGVEVVREYRSHLPQIMGDSHQLQQVFVNLLNNARQAIQGFRRDGRVAIRAFATAATVRLEFQDNGPGIKAEHIAKIFDPFFTTKAVGKGTGLGLSLVYGMIHEHGGTIRAQSEAGQGAVFIIELPTASAQEIAGSAGRGHDSRPPMAVNAVSGLGRSILVVDDEEWILSLTEQLLKREGYEVVAVLSCEKALAVLGSRTFDVIVSDWKMPGLNGMQLYEHLKATDAASAARMLFMTGDVMSDTFEQFLARNGKACLPKPFAIQDFRAAVGGMLGAK